MLVLFLRKIIILLQKMHQKFLTQLKNRARQNRARQKFRRENRANRARFLSCTKSCTISVVISNPVLDTLNGNHLETSQLTWEQKYSIGKIIVNLETFFQNNSLVTK